MWHSCLGHPHRQVLSTIAKNNNLHVSAPSSSPYQSCLLGKLSKLVFASIEHKSTAPFQIFHSDVWGPSPVTSCKGF